MPGETSEYREYGPLQTMTKNKTGKQKGKKRKPQCAQDLVHMIRKAKDG